MSSVGCICREREMRRYKECEAREGKSRYTEFMPCFVVVTFGPYAVFNLDLYFSVCVLHSFCQIYLVKVFKTIVRMALFGLKTKE